MVVAVVLHLLVVVVTVALVRRHLADDYCYWQMMVVGYC